MASADEHTDDGSTGPVMSRRPGDRLLRVVPLREATARTGLAACELQDSTDASPKVDLSSVRAVRWTEPVADVELLGRGVL